MKKTIIFSCISLLALCCQPIYYKPNSLNIPDLQKKSDATVSGGLYTDAYLSGTEFRTAFSPAKNVGLTFNYFNIFEKNDRNSSGSPAWGRGYLMEGGAGVYSAQNYSTISFFGGYGRGVVENAYLISLQDGTYARSSLTYDRWFLQPGWHFSVDHLSFGCALRYIHLKYAKHHYNELYTPDKDFTRITKERDFALWEIGGLVGTRWRYFSAHIGGTYVLNPSVVDSRIFFNLAINATATINISAIIEAAEKGKPD
ncbi:MAG: hypothetical protein SFV22_16860 [Saprospiraceae bacterium]|nr:hypothetical protein [Saprospiraceae bacterium]